MTKKINENDIDFCNEVSRSIHDHEVFISFNSDWMAEAFYDWWADIGRDSFIKFANKAMQ